MYQNLYNWSNLIQPRVEYQSDNKKLPINKKGKKKSYKNSTDHSLNDPLDVIINNPKAKMNS